MNVFSLIKMCFAKAKLDFIFVFSVEKVSSGKDSKLQVAFSLEHDYKNQFIKIRNMSVIHVFISSVYVIIIG